MRPVRRALSVRQVRQVRRVIQVLTVLPVHRVLRLAFLSGRRPRVHPRALRIFLRLPRPPAICRIA